MPSPPRGFRAVHTICMESLIIRVLRTRVTTPRIANIHTRENGMSITTAECQSCRRDQSFPVKPMYCSTNNNRTVLTCNLKPCLESKQPSCLSRYLNFQPSKKSSDILKSDKTLKETGELSLIPAE